MAQTHRRLAFLSLLAWATAIGGCYSSLSLDEDARGGDAGTRDADTPSDASTDPLLIPDAVVHPIVATESVVDGEEVVLTHVHIDRVTYCEDDLMLELSVGYLDAAGGFWREIDLSLDYYDSARPVTVCMGGKPDAGAPNVPCTFDGTLTSIRLPSGPAVALEGHVVFDAAGWDTRFEVDLSGTAENPIFCIP